jgi:6-pyruvoyl-tetrahydropterin synthase
MSRWIVHARSVFDARHALTAYNGEPEAPHFHHWEVAIQVETERLHPEGYALDFHLVRGLLDEAIAPLRDSDLNAHPVIGTPSPTAERLAQFVAEAVAPRLAAAGGRLRSVSVWEGPDNRVDFVME